MSSAITVYCDFDKTIVPIDILQLLLQELARPGWKEHEDAYKKGELNYEEYFLNLVQSILWDPKAISILIGRLQIDPSFKKFAQWCYRKKIPLIIVSTGIRQILEMLLAYEDVVVSDIWANRLVKADDGTLALGFCLPPPQEECHEACKCQVLSPKTALMNILIGETFTEPCWLKNMDIIFAKPKLQAYCRKKKFPYREFNGFEGIQKELENCLGQIRQIKWKPSLCHPDLSILNPLVQ